MLKEIKKYIFLIVAVTMLWSCATQVTPTGGPKDLKPPKIVNSEPKNFSTGFKSSTIKLSFNKFVKLTNISSNSIISPPMKVMPDFTLRGKTLIINLKEKLKDTTTYTLSLDNSIADIRENNIAKNIEYVFSTGKYLDSLEVKGLLLDAFTQKPEKDVVVMLYEKNIDSIPYKEKPLYISRTDAEGKFDIRNLKKTNFKIFALKDMNSNYVYDQPNEKIAFLDYTIKPAKRDTSKKDTLKTDKYRLQLFQEEDSIQKLLKSWVVSQNQIQMIFKYPVKKMTIELLSKETGWKNIIKEYCKSMDTLNMWMLNYNKDSIAFAIRDGKKLKDTIRFNLAQKKSTRKVGKGGEKLYMKLNVSKTIPFDYYKSIVMQSSTPLKDYNLKNIKLIDGKDTVNAMISVNDSAKRRVEIKYAFREDRNYKLFVRPNTFTDVYGITNDTIKAEFKTQEEKNYGKLTLSCNFKEYNEPKIIQLLNDKEKIIKEVTVTKKGKTEFNYLYPGIYRLRMIYDSNKNGRWDTGIYLKKIQPEKVIYYPKNITTRANWEVEVDWEEN